MLPAYQDVLRKMPKNPRPPKKVEQAAGAAD
jgi:hypothetical protein